MRRFILFYFARWELYLLAELHWTPTQIWACMRGWNSIPYTYNLKTIIESAILDYLYACTTIWQQTFSCWYNRNSTASSHMSFMYENAPHTHTPHQTLAQVDACNSSIDNPNAEDPVAVNTCFADGSSVSINLQTSSFQAGENYYYTSKS